MVVFNRLLWLVFRCPPKPHADIGVEVAGPGMCDTSQLWTETSENCKLSKPFLP